MSLPSAIRALATVNIMGNKIGNAHLSKLQEIMKAHPTLVSLCGIADDATEANLSGLWMNCDDAVVLADELPAKRALTRLDISNNNQLFSAAVGSALASALQVTCLRELDLSRGSVSPANARAFVKEFAVCLRVNGVLETLRMRDNCFKGAEAGAALGDAIAVNTVLNELDLSGGKIPAQRCDDEFIETFSVSLAGSQSRSKQSRNRIWWIISSNKTQTFRRR